jgi:hypothetical protein
MFLFLLIGNLRFLWNLAFGIWNLNSQAALALFARSTGSGLATLV